MATFNCGLYQTGSSSQKRWLTSGLQSRTTSGNTKHLLLDYDLLPTPHCATPDRSSLIKIDCSDAESGDLAGDIVVFSDELIVEEKLEQNQKNCISKGHFKAKSADYRDNRVLMVSAKVTHDYHNNIINAHSTVQLRSLGAAHSAQSQLSKLTLIS